VPLIGDNEYGHLGRQRCRRRPERREMHKGVGSLRAITHTNLSLWRRKRLYLDDRSAGSILAVMSV
jgi:hypothetical protein